MVSAITTVLFLGVLHAVTSNPVLLNSSMIGIPTTQAPTNGCPTGYSLFQGMCYKKFYNPFGSSGKDTRKQQSAQCQEIPGGNLASIPNYDVELFVERLECNSPYLRIGLQCTNVTQVSDTSSCIWDDGTPFGQNLFARCHPRISQSVSCIYSCMGVWYSDDCKDEIECSICQAPQL